MQVSKRFVFEPSCHKNKINSEIRLEKEKSLYPPFKLATPGGEHTKKQFSLPRKISSRHPCKHRHKTKHVGMSMQTTCSNARSRSGSLSSSTYCGQNGLCKLFVVRTSFSPIDLLHPCVLFALTPTKFLCQVITETS